MPTFKQVKISKQYLKSGNLEKILQQAGLVDENAKRADPSRLFMSSTDIKLLRKGVQKAYKKQYPNMYKTALDYGAGMYWLNLGPNESMAAYLKPGVFLVEMPEETK